MSYPVAFEAESDRPTEEPDRAWCHQQDAKTGTEKNSSPSDESQAKLDDGFFVRGESVVLGPGYCIKGGISGGEILALAFLA